MNWPSAPTRGFDDHRGLSLYSEVTSPSRRDLSRILSGQWRIVWLKVLGVELQLGQRSLGSRLHQEGMWPDSSCLLSFGVSALRRTYRAP